MKKLSTLATMLLLSACKPASHSPEAEGGGPDLKNARRFVSVPGSMTEIGIEITEDEGTTPDEKVFELRYGGLSYHNRYCGPAYLDSYAIGLYRFEGDTVSLRSNGDNIYIREGLLIQEAYRQGWCVTELGADGFLHTESIKRFFESMEADEDNQPNKE